MNSTTPSEITKMNRAGSFVSFSLGHRSEGKTLVLVKRWTWDLTREQTGIEEYVTINGCEEI